MRTTKLDVAVIGAGPAGIFSAIRAADLGARTALLARDEFGGMAANDGPVPVRTLAHAARLLRDASQLDRYGIVAQELRLNYSQLLQRVQEVKEDVRSHSALRSQVDAAGASVFERVGTIRFLDSHTIAAESGQRWEAEKIILCTGGTSRRLTVPGAELTNTHSDAWTLQSVPDSMLVIGAGATGAQVASIFHAFGAHIQLFQAGPRILPTEDVDVSKSVAAAFRASGIEIHENFGSIDKFEKTANGIRMFFTKDGKQASAEASLIVLAVGWVANTVGLNLEAAGVALNSRGFIEVNQFLQTSARNIFAAGDITGRLMLVPQAIQDGHLASTNAVQGLILPLEKQVSPIGSFTDPEYAQVGLTEENARKKYDVVVGMIPFHETTRAIIDGRTLGFCKLIVDRISQKIVGCHVVGEQAVEIAQMAATAMAAGMPVQELARLPLSFPTYAGILGRAATFITRQLNREKIDLKNVA